MKCISILMLILFLKQVSDKVWHPGLIYNLQLFGIKDSLLHFLERFSGYTCQPVLLKVQESNWLPVKAGI